MSHTQMKRLKKKFQLRDDQDLVNAGMAHTQVKRLKKKYQLRDDQGMGTTQKKRLKKTFQLRDEDEEGNDQHRSAVGITTMQKKMLKTTFQVRDEDEEGNEQHQFSQPTIVSTSRRYAPREEGRRTNGIEDEEELTQIEQIGGKNMESPSFNKKVRGPTLMVKMWGLPRGHPKVKILTNALSQPIGPTKTTFVEFIGCVARNGQFAPIHFKSWHHMPLDKKIHMVAIVKEKFEVPPGMQYWISKAIGRRWKNWKAYLKARYYKENTPMDCQVQMKDSRVVKEQWKEITAYWRTDEAKRMSKKNKRVRQKKTINHRTGKKSFAQVYDVLKDDEKDVGPPTRVRLFKACYLDKNQNAKSSDVADVVATMDERTSQLPAGFHDEIAPDDVFAQVIGKDGNGRVRMMGGGVAPSDLWDSFPSRGVSYRMAMEYKSALEQQAEINKKLMDELAEIRAILNQRGTSSARSASSVQQHVQTSRPLQVNTFVAMKSFYNATKTVAEGILQSLDPACVVGGQVLGKGWCSILVQVQVDPLEELI